MSRSTKVGIGSTVIRRALGRQLTLLRQRAGIKSVTKAAELVGISAATMFRHESGVTAIKARDVRPLCDIYCVSEEMEAVVMSLVDTDRFSADPLVPHNDRFDLCADLETLAGRIRFYAPLTVPALFRTERCAAALGQPLGPMRCHLRPSDQVELVIAEAALLGLAGDPQVRAEQVERLCEVSDFPGVSVRIEPITNPRHGCAAFGAFEVLDFHATIGSSRPEPMTVVVDTYRGALYFDEMRHPNEVSEFEFAFTTVQSEAMGEEQSRLMLDEMRLAHRGQLI